MLKSLFKAVADYFEQRESRSAVRFLEKRKEMAGHGLLLWPSPAGNIVIDRLNETESALVISECDQGIASITKKRSTTMPTIKAAP